MNGKPRGHTADAADVKPTAVDLDQKPATATAPHATVTAGLEYLASLERQRDALHEREEFLLKKSKLDGLEISSLASRLSAAESRVAELQIRADDAVRKEAGLAKTLEIIIRAAMTGTDRDPSEIITPRDHGVTIGH